MKMKMKMKAGQSQLVVLVSRSVSARALGSRGFTFIFDTSLAKKKMQSGCGGCSTISSCLRSPLFFFFFFFNLI